MREPEKAFWTQGVAVVTFFIPLKNCDWNMPESTPLPVLSVSGMKKCLASVALLPGLVALELRIFKARWTTLFV